MNHPHEYGRGGAVFLVISWLGTALSSIAPQHIPIILSSVASCFAMVNYYIQIKRNLRK